MWGAKVEQTSPAAQVFPGTPSCCPPLTAQCGQHQQEQGPPSQYTCANAIQPRLNVHAGTAVCKAASLFRRVPKAAPSLLAATKASGELSCEGLPVSPGQCRDFPLQPSPCLHRNTYCKHAPANLSPRRRPAHLDFLPVRPCVQSIHFHSTTAKSECVAIPLPPSLQIDRGAPFPGERKPRMP